MTSLCCPRLSALSNIFSSETTGPIEVKFYVEHPWNGRKKVCMGGPGHMTKMAASPYKVNLSKSSSLEPVGQLS